jgi:hypothetical protein
MEASEKFVRKKLSKGKQGDSASYSRSLQDIEGALPEYDPWQVALALSALVHAEGESGNTRRKAQVLEIVRATC